MHIAIPTTPPPPPPAPLRCEGCGVACAPDEALATTDVLIAVCHACWARPRDVPYALSVRTAGDLVGHRAAKAAKNAILAAIERAIGIGDEVESP